MPRHTYATQKQAADHIGVTVRTIRNWISEGLITGYKLPGGRAIRVDLDEITNKMKAMPTAMRPRQPFGPKANIVQVVEEYQAEAPQMVSDGATPDE
jgi:excisionase family DNA binding protein